MSGKELSRLPQGHTVPSVRSAKARAAPHDQEIADNPAQRRMRFAFLLVVIAVFVLLVLRRPDAITNPQFWAEDARLFFRDQLIFGAAGSLFHPYAGYLNLVPRLTAAFASLFPVLYAPLLYNLTALVIASIACSMFFLPAYRGLLRSDALRLLVCVVVASAFFNHELIGTITNSQWYLGLAGLLIIARPAPMDEQASWAHVVVLAVACILIGLSAPVTVVLAPLALWKIAAARLSKAPGKVWMAPACLLAALAVQIGIFILTSPLSTRTLDFDALLGSTLVALIYKTLLSSVAGQSAAIMISESRSPIAIILIFAITSAWLTWLIWRARTKRTQIALALYVAFSSVFLIFLSRDLGETFSTLVRIVEWRGERYFFLSSCVLVYLVALSAEVLLPRTSQVWKLVVVALVFLPGALANFRVAPFVDYGWPEQAEQVQQWYSSFQAGRPAKAMSFNMNPRTADFLLTLPRQAPSLEEFEGALTWNRYGSVDDPSVTTETARRGQQSVCQTGAGDGGLYQDYIGLQPGRKYRVAAWVSAERSQDASAYVWVHDVRGNNTVASPPLVPDSSWRPLEVVFTATEERMLRVHLHRAGAGSVCFDDVAVSELDGPESISAGSLPKLPKALPGGSSTEGFEEGSSGWQPFGVATERSVANKAARTGRHSFCQTGPGDGGVYKDYMGLVSGRKYRVAVWIHGESPPTSSAWLWVHDTQNGNEVASPTIPADEKWRPLEVLFTANETRALRIHLRLGGGPGSVCFDDVSVSEL